MAQNPPTSTPTPAQVRAQRDRMFASKLFALSNRTRTFLSFIIDAELEGRADKLKEYTLGVEVFDKDDSFDPSIDSIVRVEASRLRAKLREYYDSEGERDPVKIDVPKGHYVPVFGYIDTDCDADFLQRERADRNKTNTHDIRGTLSLTLAGLAVAAALYLAADNWEDPPSFEPTAEIYHKSVAVLPFLPLSSGENDGYFADGLTEEILNSLTQLPELQVTARTSSFYFKGQDLLVPDIASRLGVAHVVEGSVRRDGDRIRVAVQLIRASDAFHLWSRNYDRTLDDVFAVQEDIAEHIAEVLGVVLDDAARAVMHGSGIRDVDAFIAYQKGREAWVAAHQDVTMSEALLISNKHFEVALETTPGLTMARLMKADLRGHIVFEIVAGLRDEDFPGELQQTLAALREEYGLAVRSSAAGNQRDLLELERTLFSEAWTGLPERIRRAMHPGKCPQMNWTSLVAHFGWADELVTKLREAIKCNPLDTYASYHLAWSLIWSGDAHAALQAIDNADDKGLSHPSLNDGRYWALLASGDIDNLGTLGTGNGDSRLPYDRQILREALIGDPTVARQMAEDYWAGPDADDLSSIIIAAVIGDRDKANATVARLDAHPGSAAVISHAVFSCFCGAPFDLDAAPNYKARITEAGFTWPPPKRIDYPAKTW